MGFFYGFDMTYLVFIVPCIIITLICQVKVKTTFSKYSQIRNSRNMTGAQAAEYVLRQHGVTGVRIEHVAGSMTDHFDPRTNVIRLSDTVFNSTSVAAVGVACHEAGHAVQHAENYLPNRIRSFILPVARLGSSLSWIFIIVGFCFTQRVGLLYGEEYTGAKRVLQAAAMTYVAAALTAIMQLLRLIIIANNRRR